MVVRPLPRSLAKKAQLELNENPADIPYYINALREWVKSQPHLKSRTSDQFLIVFLRGGKFSLEKAKQKLLNYYTYRTMIPELYINRDINDPKIYSIVQSGSLLYFTEPVSEDGPRVVMIRPSLFDMEKHTIPDVFKVGCMFTDILLYEDDNAIVAGYILIMDLANIPKSVMFSFDPNYARKLTILVNKANPARMKGFHFLNVPTIFEKLFNMVKSVINTKLRERFYVHGSNLEALYDHVPRRVLPREYGGNFDIEEAKIYFWNKFCQHKDLLKDEESYGVTKEYLNSKAIKDDDKAAIFGVEGSFRKLNLD